MARQLLGYTNEDFEQLFLQGELNFDILGSVDDFTFEVNLNGDLELKKANDTIVTFDTDSLIFKTNSNERFRIDNTGKIGIGTNNPTSLLHLMNGSSPQLLLDNNVFGQNTIKFQSNRSSANIIGDMSWFNNDTSNIEIARIRIQKSDAANGNGEIQFHTANGTTLGQRMTITNDGFVGLGAATNPIISIAFGKNNTGIDRMTDTWISMKTNGVETINYDTLSVNLFGGTTTSAGPGLYVRKKATASNSNVFTQYYRSATDASTGGIFEGSVRTNSGGNLVIDNLSDVRLKENIIDYTNGYNKVKELRTVEYEWIDPQKKTEIGRIVGFIAQEVEIVIPKSIGTFTQNQTDYLTISITEMIPFLWSALRKVITDKELLETQILNLQTENITIKSRLDALEAFHP